MFATGHPKTICHSGTVQKTENRYVLVSITSHTACSGCHAEGICSLSGKEEKIIEVTGFYNVKQGDEVTVHIKQSTGYIALLLAYILPLTTIVLSLVIFIMLKMSELTAGILSIAMMIPYFTILFLFRKRLNDKFIFTLNV